MKKFLLTCLLISTISYSQCWQKVFAGDATSFGIKTDGTLWAWGVNDFGEIGDGTIIDKYIPVPIGTDTDWKFVSEGFAHTIALKNDGTMWVWGKNDVGQLGIGTTQERHTPLQLGTDFWKMVATEQNYTVAIKSDGTLWAWGDNSKGQLGNGTLTDQHSPIQIGNDNTWSYMHVDGIIQLRLKAMAPYGPGERIITDN